MTADYQSLRREYGAIPLNESDLQETPMASFKEWFALAIEEQPLDANAFVLATVDVTGAPDARVLLLKAIQDTGFTFFTCYQSPTGIQLAAHPQAQATFFWPALSRQVRLKGTCQKLSREESEAYFASRPLNSQYAAMAAQQSQVIPGRKHLESAYEDLQRQETPPACPEDWGGYIFEVSVAEFFQGRNNRLNDRLVYQKNKAAGNTWKIRRLAP